MHIHNMSLRHCLLALNIFYYPSNQSSFIKLSAPMMFSDQGTIHLRRPWTSAFFRLASGTVGFSPRLKNSGHVITFLRRCGWQNTDHVMPFWPLKVDSLSHVFPAFVTVQRKERCPLYKILSTLAGVYAQWTALRLV